MERLEEAKDTKMENLEKVGPTTLIAGLVHNTNDMKISNYETSIIFFTATVTLYS